MKLWSDSFADGARIPERLAFGKADPTTHIALAGNRNPHLAWSGLPEGTRSLVLICHDPDVPSRPDGVNQEGHVIPATLPRVDFAHWVLVDLDPHMDISEGAFSEGITARGKSGPAGPHGTRQGVNDYTAWFAGDKDMEGTYFGYDGPCPPWNDERLHHYHFTLYALDVPRCPVEGSFGVAEVRAALEGHTLGIASIVGTYATNPEL
ncbi:MAG: UPF0098 protein [Myxococcales bacterium]